MHDIPGQYRDYIRADWRERLADVQHEWSRRGGGGQIHASAHELAVKTFNQSEMWERSPRPRASTAHLACRMPF